MKEIKIMIESFEEFRKLMRLLSLSKTSYQWNSDEKPQDYTPECAKTCSKKYPMQINITSFDTDYIHYLTYLSSVNSSTYIPFASFVNKLRLEMEAFPIECILPEIK